MSDGNIHFPPGQRREKPAFEPPPWEREKFDELARRKAEHEAREAEAGRQATAAVEPVAGPAEEPADQEATPPAESKPAETEAEKAETDAETAVEAEKPELDMSQVELMMMGLRAEEPRPEETFAKATTAAGVISALVGLALTTWGFIALAMPKQPGAGTTVLVGSLLLFGFGFLGGGAWVIYKSLRQQGVL